MAERRLLIPGTYDPITCGHLSLIERCCALADDVLVAVAKGAHKQPLLPLATRRTMCEQACQDLPKVRVTTFEGLLVDLMEREQMMTYARGLRTFSDFEREQQLLLMHQQLNAEVDAVYLMADPALSAISSSWVREVAAMGGDITAWVPSAVCELWP